MTTRRASDAQRKAGRLPACDDPVNRREQAVSERTFIACAAAAMVHRRDRIAPAERARPRRLTRPRIYARRPAGFVFEDVVIATAGVQIGPVGATAVGVVRPERAAVVDLAVLRCTVAGGGN